MDFKEKLKDLIIEDNPLKIRKTAEVLEGLKYSPILLSEYPDFLRTDSKIFFKEIEKLTQNDDLQDAAVSSEKKVSILLYHYKLLNRLRRDEVAAWDEVNELMEDD